MEFVELSQVDTDSDFPMEKTESGYTSMLFPQDDVPEVSKAPYYNTTKMIRTLSCPVVGCAMYWHAFKKHRQLQDHWNRCHWTKSLKTICNICQWQVFKKSQMKRHLQQEHVVSEVDGNYHWWWCICPVSRYIERQRFNIAHTDAHRKYPLKRLATANRANPSLSRASSTSNFVTPPSSPPPPKKCREHPEPSESTVGAVSTVALDVEHPPSLVAGGHQEGSGCTDGATAAPILVGCGPSCGTNGVHAGPVPMGWEQPHSTYTSSVLASSPLEAARGATADNAWVRSLF